MLKQEDSSTGAGGCNTWARVCDTCRSAACRVYCRADSAYLCTGCDARIHSANKVASLHERVWVCEACERAPAAFLCKADAASLCTTCDSDIHSANPLARRHHRVPILPIPCTLYGPQATDPGVSLIGDSATEDAEDDGFLTQDFDETIDENDEDEAASWLLLNPLKNNNYNNHNQTSNNNNNNNGILLGGEVVDEYLDLVEYSSCQENHYAHPNDHYYTNNQHQNYAVPQKKSFGGDSVVPVRSGGGGGGGKDQLQQQNQHHQGFQFGLEYEASNTGYGYPASMSHSVSILQFFF